MDPDNQKYRPVDEEVSSSLFKIKTNLATLNKVKVKASVFFAISGAAGIIAATTLVLSESTNVPAIINNKAHITYTDTNGANNYEADSNEVTATVVDNKAPVISNVSIKNVDYQSAIITWLTDEDATSKVDYGKTTSYESSTTEDLNLTASHNVNLSSLEASTTYHYRVRSTDASKNEVVSMDYSFTTAPPPDIIPPVISNIGEANITKNSISITWKTDENSTSQVEYGLTEDLKSSTTTTLNSNLTTNHSVNLSNLKTERTYYYRVKSKDASNNEQVSSIENFSTLAGVKANLSFSPLTGNFKLGDYFKVDVVLNTGDYEADKIDIHYLKYNPNLLQVESLQKGSLLANTTLEKTDVIGQIDFSQTSNGENYQGTGILFSVNFKVIKEGIAAIYLDYLANSTNECNVYSAGKDILTQVKEASMTLSFCKDNLDCNDSNFCTKDLCNSPATAQALCQNSAITLCANDDHCCAPSCVKCNDNDCSNRNPNQATSPIPKNTATEIALNTDLAWQGGDPDTCDSLTYEIFFSKDTDILKSLGTSQDPKLLNSKLPILNSNTRYQWKVITKDGTGSTESPIWTFTTVDIEKPQISNVQVSNLTASSATIEWATNEGSTSKVEYSKNADLSSSTVTSINSVLDTVHAVNLSGLNSATVYYYRTISSDMSSNEAQSEISNFTTLTSSGKTILRNFQITVYPETNKFIGNIEISLLSVDKKVELTKQVSATAEINFATSSALTEGIYELKIFIPYHLVKIIPTVSLMNNTTFEIKNIYTGDLNQDNKINSLDWSIMSTRWGKSDPLADLNQDGAINSLDWSWLNKNWNKIGDNL